MFMSTVRVMPKNISCLSNCQGMFDYPSIADADCRDENGPLYQNFYDCYIDNRKMKETAVSYAGDVADVYINMDYNMKGWVFDLCYLANYFKDEGIDTCEDIQGFIPQSPFTFRKKGKKRKRGKKGKRGRKGRLAGEAGPPTKMSWTFNTGYPWMCSLRTRGFRGRHYCGLTLLSGPSPLTPVNTTILVGAAHCNYVCRNDRGHILETCCCRSDPFSECKTKSFYCDGNPRLERARPSEMQVVCGEHNIAPVPEHISWEREIVLDIMKITVHPKFKEMNPLEGNDIAVYIVNETQSRERLVLQRPTPEIFVNVTTEQQLLKNISKIIYPACLPRPSYAYEDAIFSSWLDPKPQYLKPMNPLQPTGNTPPRFEDFFTANFLRDNIFMISNVWPRHVRLKETECKDPARMNSNTFYPAGTTCYRDETLSSCQMFGSSGSGIVRKFKEVKEEEPASDILYNWINKTSRYAFIGPLSLYKGCDGSMPVKMDDIDHDFDFNSKVRGKDTLDINPSEIQMSYTGENVSVFTSAYCFLDWIAEQYNMNPPKGWSKPASCEKSTGDLSDKNKTECSTANGKNKCNFNTDKWTRIKLGAFDKMVKMNQCHLLDIGGGFAENINICINDEGHLDTCANNCRGVEANAVVVGGIAAIAASSLVGQSVLPALAPFFLGGGALTVGAGAMMGMNAMMNPVREVRECPILQPCRAGNRCCEQAFNNLNGQFQCPTFCPP